MPVQSLEKESDVKSKGQDGHSTDSPIAEYLAEDQDSAVDVSIEEMSRKDEKNDPSASRTPSGRQAVPMFPNHLLWLTVVIALILLILIFLSWT